MAGTRGGSKGDVRSSALWGTGNRGGGDHKSRARGAAAIAAALSAVFLAVPLAAGADDGKRSTQPTYVAPGVYQAAKNDPDGLVQVIIQSASTGKATDAVKDAEKTAADINDEAADATKAEQQAAAAETKAVAEARDAASDADEATARARRADRKSKTAADRAAEKAAAKAARLLARAVEAQNGHTAASSTARRWN